VYLNNHGGYSNAYTAGENTVYYFDVQNEFFEGALDIFSAFFTCPLFTEAATSREMNAVDNENTKNLQSDGWRDYQLLKHMAKAEHPFSNFGTGNIETLKTIPESKGLVTRDLLLAFHKRYYSANIMKLVVYGSEPLDVMQAWAEGKFSGVENKDVPVPSFPPDPYGPAQLSHVLEVVPVKDAKSLDVNFPIPALDPYYRSLPMRYISHLLGHEAEGSLLSYYKEKGWANGIGAYASKCFDEFATSGVSIDLTDEGCEHIDELMEHLFAYIGLLVNTGPLEWVAEEVKTEAGNAFRLVVWYCSIY
jgi:insulysin